MLNRKCLGISLSSWFLALIIVSAFLIRIRGIDWPRFHPDEYPIAQWIERGGPDRVYAGGTFVLIRPFRFGWEKTLSVAARVRAYTGHEPVEVPRPDYVLMGRYFNALIGSLACIFIYLTANTMLKSRSAALFSALLMAFAQLPVEHAHYAQSDISMLFVMCVLMWLWTTSLTREKAGWFVAAGLACGAAAGTKFTLMILLFPWLLSCLLRGLGAPRGRRLWGSVKYPVAGLLLFAAGLVAASPAILDLESFMAGMAHEKVRVYGETVNNLGIMAGDNRVRMLTHLYALGRNMLTPGLGWLVLWIASLPLLLRRDTRRFWIPFLAVPLVYTYYWIAVAPWVRTQEFLNYLPFAAVLAAVPLVIAWRRWSHPAVKCLVLIAALAAFGCSFHHSMRVSSIYGWLDSRLLATRWLQRHEPPGVTLAAEKYANVQPRGTRVGVDMAARVGLETLQAQGFDYLLSQGTKGTRGMFNPLTGDLYPHYQTAYEHFMDGTDFLKSWALMPSVGTHTSFSSMPIELFGLHKGTGEHVLDVPMSRPAFISHERFETLSPRGHHLATATAFLVDHHGVTFGISSAQELDQPVYIVLYTEERPAEVKLRGLGRRKRVRLAPYDHAVVPLQRPVWSPRLGHIETIHASATPRKHITHIPCYLQLAFSRQEADAIIADLPSAPDRSARFSPEQRDRLQAMMDVEPTAIDYMGISASAYDQFARFHFPDTTRATQPLRVDLTLPPDMPETTVPVFSGTLALPFRRTPAPLTVRLDVNVAMESPVPDGDAPSIRFIDDRTGFELATLVVNQVADAWVRDVTLTFPRGRAGALDIRMESSVQAGLRFENIELSWRFHDVLQTELRPGDARDAAQPVVPEAASDRQTEPVDALDVEFAPFVRLIGLSHENPEGLTVLFEARQNTPPALNAVLCRLKRGRWRVVDRVPLFAGQVTAGERITVAFKQDPDASRNNGGVLGIGIETSVPWFPGRLRIAGREEDIFRLPERTGK